MKRFLITMNGETPFMTDYFDAENHWYSGITAYDLLKGLYMTDGITWNQIEEDHL